jgi:hypothetical protein
MISPKILNLGSLKSLVEAMICYSKRHEGWIKKQIMNSHFVCFMNQDVMSLPLQDLKLDENDQPRQQPSNMELDETTDEGQALETKSMKESGDLNHDSEEVLERKQTVRGSQVF